MKRKRTFTFKKLLFYIFVILAVGFYIFTKLLSPNKTPNSFKNAGYLGNALYYDTLKELDYNVSYELSPIKPHPQEALVVLNVASAAEELTEVDYQLIFDYVRAGGQMLVLFLDTTMGDQHTPPPESFKPIVDELVGQPFDKWVCGTEGVLMYGSNEILGNISLSMDREVAYRTLQMLHPYMDQEGIVFNEYYLYVTQGGKRSLWKEMPQGVKVTLIQLLIACLWFIAYKGKRFGAPLKLYEEVEPDENQYAKAVGSLYYGAGHWEVLLDAYYQHLLNRIYRKYLLYMDVGEENWIAAFETANDKAYKSAKKVLHFMNAYHAGELKNLSKRKTRKRMKEILIAIQNLERSLD